MEEETRVVSHKARCFANSTLLTLEQDKRFLEDFLERKIVPSKNINFYKFPGLGLVEMFLKMDRLPILSLCTPVYTTFVRLFYCKAIFSGVGDMMKKKSSIKGVDIELNAEKICEILGIKPIGECVY